MTGLIGWHVRAYLHGQAGVVVRGATRSDFADPEALTGFVGGLDAVVHLAGMNRGDDAEVETVNVDLAENLVAALERRDATPHVLFSSSTHIERDTAYGRSKRESATRLRRWAEKRGALFTNLILPHVFGEFGKPFYNSVVSTFCHQLATGETPQILRDGQVELVHTQQVAAEVFRAVLDRRDGERRIGGEPVQVSELLARLERMAELYRGQVLPDLRHPLDQRLFNTYRSYLFPHFYPIAAKVHRDERGKLFEAVRSLTNGQTFFSTTHPGVTRGNHYHARKVERFLVAEGEAVIRVRRLFSREVVEFRLSGDRPQYVDMPTFHTHSITNIGSSDLQTLFWANEIFDPTDSDTHAEPVVLACLDSRS